MDDAPGRAPAPAPQGEETVAPRTQAAFFGEQAAEAWREGQAALQEGDLPRALFWMERAWRLAPDDPAAALALAGARLRQGDAEGARAVLEPVAARVDSREALLLLSAARLASGDGTGAGVALAAMLSGHLVAPGPELAALARGVAQRVGAPGWCGVAPDGSAWAASAAGGRAEFRLDEQDWAPDVVPPGAARLEVAIGGRACLGSPIDLRRARRVEGVVTARDGGLEGWAWHPGNPEADPALAVISADGQARIALVADDTAITAGGALARPRRFQISAGRLAALVPPLRVTGPDGRDLPGSPLDPGAETRTAVAIAQAVARRFPLRGTPSGAEEPLAHAATNAALRGPPARAKAAPGRAVAVVVPAYRGTAITRRCLEAVRATAPSGTLVVVVDDATPEPALAALLDEMSQAGHIRLLRQPANRGFPASANAGLRLAARLAPGADLVLLNSDAIPAPGWIEGLRASVHAAGDIGTATPLSNDATILSYPDITRTNPPPQGTALARLAKLAARANQGVAVEIPTAVGFCMYIRRECLAATGLFREDSFAQGYGEENDLCLRARHLGWRHVGVPGVFVAHEGGQSFGAATSPLVARNLAVLERLHPGYAALIAAFQATDPLAEARRHLDAARWQAARRKGAGQAVVLVTHDSGGGVERVVRARCSALQAEGRRAILLRPVTDRMRASATGPAARPGLVRVEEAGGAPYPNLIFAVPDDLPALAQLLRADKPALLEVHHLLGHDHALLRLAGLLGVPEEVHLHDYAWFCPRVTLLGPERRYCGEPEDPRECDACVADAGRVLEEALPTAALRARSAADLARARRVVAPSADTAARMRRHFPGLAPEVVALEDDAAALATARSLPRPALLEGEFRRVAIIGGIGTEKGYDVILACARDARVRNLKVQFTIVGHTRDDRRLLDTGRVLVTGGYREGDGEALVRAHRPHLAFLPSLWPETWCFTLGVAWRAGLRTAVFDIGAQAERVRASGHGWILPLGLPAAAINNALLAVEP